MGSKRRDCVLQGEEIVSHGKEKERDCVLQGRGERVLHGNCRGESVCFAGKECVLHGKENETVGFAGEGGSAGRECDKRVLSFGLRTPVLTHGTGPVPFLDHVPCIL